MLEFQRELGVQIAEQIRLRLSPDRSLRWRDGIAADAEAYDLYLRGLYPWGSSGRKRTVARSSSIAARPRATPTTRSLGPAWRSPMPARRSMLTHRHAWVWPLAREAADRGSPPTRALAETQAAMGMVQFWLEWNWSRCRRRVRPGRRDRSQLSAGPPDDRHRRIASTATRRRAPTDGSTAHASRRSTP